MRSNPSGLSTLLLAGAAIAAYMMFKKPVGAANPTAPGVQPAAKDQTQTPAANPVTTQQLVLAAAGKDGFTMGNVDQWNWFYQKARSVSAPDPGGFLTPEARAQNLTFPEWWALVSAHGLSGGIQRRSY